jgi:hypothetical protein
MAKLVLAALLIFPTLAQAPIDAELMRKVIAVELPWDTFVRKLFGCPESGPTTEETCNPTLGHIDYAAFKKSCQAAAELYGFKKEECSKVR